MLRQFLLVVLQRHASAEQRRLLGAFDQLTLDIKGVVITIGQQGQRCKDIARHLLHRLHQRQLPPPGTAHQRVGNDQAIDLIGTFKDAIDTGIAVGTRRRRFFNKA